MMKRLLLLMIGLVLSSLAFAYSEINNYTFCYTFSNNVVKSKGKCMVESGGGMGGSVYTVSMGRQSYEAEESYSNGTERHLLNGHSAKVYYRNQSLKIAKQSNNANYYCFKTIDGKIDLCWAY